MGVKIKRQPLIAEITLTMSLATAQELCAFLQGGCVGANSKDLFGNVYFPLYQALVAEGEDFSDERATDLYHTFKRG